MSVNKHGINFCYKCGGSLKKTSVIPYAVYSCVKCSSFFKKTVSIQDISDLRLKDLGVLK